MSSVDTWPKAVQNWLKAAHISPRFRGRLAFWLAGTRFESFVANVVLVPSGLLLTLASPASVHLPQIGRPHTIFSRDLHQDFD